MVTNVRRQYEELISQSPLFAPEAFVVDHHIVFLPNKVDDFNRVAPLPSTRIWPHRTTALRVGDCFTHRWNDLSKFHTAAQKFIKQFLGLNLSILIVPGLPKTPYPEMLEAIAGFPKLSFFEMEAKGKFGFHDNYVCLNPLPCLLNYNNLAAVQTVTLNLVMNETGQFQGHGILLSLNTETKHQNITHLNIIIGHNLKP